MAGSIGAPLGIRGLSVVLSESNRAPLGVDVNEAIACSPNDLSKWSLQLGFPMFVYILEHCDLRFCPPSQRLELVTSLIVVYERPPGSNLRRLQIQLQAANSGGCEADLKRKINKAFDSAARLEFDQCSFRWNLSSQTVFAYWSNFIQTRMVKKMEWYLPKEMTIFWS